MLPVERKKAILDLIDEKSSVTVSELSDILGISEVSVRKMLNEMDAQGLLHRTHGGAVGLNMLLPERDQKEKEKENVEEKKAIAAVAYSLIEDSSTIFLDAGSTTLEIARLIKQGDKRNIIVVTNALNIASEFLESYDIEIVLIGGNVRHKIMSCVGPLAERALESICLDKVFLGANSVDAQMGVTTPNLHEAEMKRKMINSSNEAYLVCDYTKYGKKNMARVCTLQTFSGIIVDWNMPKKEREMLINDNIQLLVAENR